MAELRLLEELSDDLGNPGIGPLWLAAKRKAIGVSKKQVEAFVKRQGEKQIFQAVQPAKGKTVSESQDARWMMDLVFFTSSLSWLPALPCGTFWSVSTSSIVTFTRSLSKAKRPRM
jgi:hypothetical protein